MALWPCGPVALWPFCPVALWPCDPVALLPCGPVALWPCGPVALWPCCPVALLPCCPVTLNRLHAAGVQVAQATGLSGVAPALPFLPGSALPHHPAEDLQPLGAGQRWGPLSCCLIRLSPPFAEVLPSVLLVYLLLDCPDFPEACPGCCSPQHVIRLVVWQQHCDICLIPPRCLLPDCWLYL